LINPDLEANLFDLAEVDFAAAPGGLADMRLTDEGFSRSAAIGPSFTPGAPFTLADLSSLSAKNIAKLKAQTITRLKPLDYPIEDMYIERNGPSAKAR
jgi:hypothetical protein